MKNGFAKKKALSWKQKVTDENHLVIICSHTNENSKFELYLILSRFYFLLECDPKKAKSYP